MADLDKIIISGSGKHFTKSRRHKIKRNQLLSTVSLISLAACGGGTSPAPTQPRAPEPDPLPDFNETSTNVFTGTSGSNLTLDQGSSTSNITVTSLGGNDTITTGTGSDVIDGGEGNNTISVGEGNNTITVGSGDNLINGGNGGNLVYGSHGNNNVKLGNGNNNVKLGNGHNNVEVGNGNNVVSTGNGDDIITAGPGGNIIHTGPGNDIITVRNGNSSINSGDGNDTITVTGDTGSDGGIIIINPGGGADVVQVETTTTTFPFDTTIVIVGDTTGLTYTANDISSPIGGVDLADVLTLDYLNNHPVSDIVAGEMLDGGSGISSLEIFGEVDLSGILLRNMEHLNFDYKLSLTPEQLQQFLSIRGDGASDLNITGGTDGELLMLDITQFSFEDIASLYYSGNLQVTMSEISQIDGIGEFIVGEQFSIVLEDDGTGQNQITLSELASAVLGADAIDVTSLVTMFIDDPDGISGLNLSQLTGDGTVILSDIAASGLLFDGVIVDDSITILNTEGFVVSAEDLGATVVGTITPEDVGVLPEITIKDVNVFESAEEATFTVLLNARYYEDVTVDYVAPDGTTGTLTFAAGEVSQTFTTSWTDDTVHELTELQTASLSNPTNSTIVDGSGQLGIVNDDEAPALSISSVTVNEGDGTVSYTVSLDGTSFEDVYFDWETKDWTALAGTHYTATGGTGVTIAAGDTSTTITVSLIDNAVNLGSNVFNITLSNISFSSTTEDINVATTILDNDAIILNSLDGVNGFVINGEAVADHSGAAVSGLGDINGDGYGDFIIGASDADPDGNNDAGSSYIIYGKDTVDSGSGVIDLLSLNGSNGFIVNGVTGGDLSGYSVSAAGDVNGDGYNDIIIGAKQADANGDASGASYVIYGGASISSGAGTLDLSSLDGSNGFVLNGAEAGDQSGTSVSSAGDINNDGYDDLLIGTYAASPAGDIATGASYIVYGGTNVDGGSGIVELADLDGSNGFVLAGIDMLDSSGSSVSNVGDVNGDGYDDIIIGANSADNGGDLNVGESYLVYGGTGIDGSDGYFDLATLDGDNGFVLGGIDAQDMSGYSVSGAGDINGDGFNDLIIGAWAASSGGESDAGQTYIVYGGTDMSAGSGSLDLSTLDGSNGFVLGGIDAGDMSGVSVSGAGDVNGDGYDDFIIGASGADSDSASRAGEAYIVYGGMNVDGSDGVFDLADIDGSSGFVVSGSAADDEAGVSVSAAGDVNGDGYDDILVGASGADAGGNVAAGQSYIIYGSATDGSNTFDNPVWTDSVDFLAIDDAETGDIEQAGEDDWYQVHLVAGQVYFFSVTGSASGNGTLYDPRLVGLYDSSGNRLPGAFDDDGYGSSRESAMLFTATQTGTYYIAVDGSNANTGTYQIAVSDMSATLNGALPYGPTDAYSWADFDSGIALTGDDRIDALLSQFRYSVTSETEPTVVTFSFPTTNTNYSQFSDYGYGTSGQEPWINFSALTTGQQTSFREILGDLESGVNIDFVEVMDTDYSAGTIRVAWTGESQGGALAWAYYPGNGSKAGDLWLSANNLSPTADATPGSQLYFIMMHELGHTLGLDHSFDGVVSLPAENDGREYTVMAYTDSVYLPNVISADLYPQSFMYYDMLALNYLYGPAMTDFNDNHYTFDGNDRYYMTIWDLGGDDTIEFANQTQGITINLGAGQWLDVGTIITYDTTGGPVYQNQTVYLPVDSSIENAYGTTHDDTITGGDVANGLRGMQGDDSLSGAGGDDMLDGGTGADQLTGGLGADVFVTRTGDGGASIADADFVLDFTDGEDLIGLNDLSYADLTISDGTGANAGDTIIQDTASGEYLMVLDGIAAVDVTAADFTVVQDDWWLA